MVLKIFYREDRDYSRSITEFVEHVKRRGVEQKIELVDPDSKEGSLAVEAYGINKYPAFVAVSQSGGALQVWQDEVPLIDEVLSYSYS
jgi:hypothetical protein